MQLTADFLKLMIGQVEDPRLKNELNYKYHVAINERDLELIDLAIQKFKKSKGVCPSSIEELVEKRYLASYPKDPFGKGYYIKEPQCQAATYAVYESIKKVYIIKEEESGERHN
jgi:hypothetical protein